jgi:hypothetical protein
MSVNAYSRPLALGQRRASFLQQTSSAHISPVNTPSPVHSSNDVPASVSLVTDAPSVISTAQPAPVAPTATNSQSTQFPPSPSLHANSPTFPALPPMGPPTLSLAQSTGGNAPNLFSPLSGMPPPPSGDFTFPASPPPPSPFTQNSARLVSVSDLVDLNAPPPSVQVRTTSEQPQL